MRQGATDGHAYTQYSRTTEGEPDGRTCLCISQWLTLENRHALHFTHFLRSFVSALPHSKLLCLDRLMEGHGHVRRRSRRELMGEVLLCVVSNERCRFEKTDATSRLHHCHAAGLPSNPPPTGPSRRRPLLQAIGELGSAYRISTTARYWLIATHPGKH